MNFVNIPPSKKGPSPNTPGEPLIKHTNICLTEKEYEFLTKQALSRKITKGAVLRKALHILMENENGH